MAAPASGTGKTTVATGLIAALRGRGLAVSPHKVGPDYIDPGYHALAAGREGRNLDPWLVGAERVAPLLAHGASTPSLAEVAIVEGAMGLHDGAAGRGAFASTAHVARLVDAPVLLVVDAASQGRSAAALVLGMRLFDPAVRVAGVILNRVGSDRHESMLRQALAEIAVPVVGVIRRNPAIVTPDRHLGLIPVAERSAEAIETVAALGELVAQSVDLDAVLAIAGSAPPLAAAAWDPVLEVCGVDGGPGPVVADGGSGPTVAVAGGQAFTFCYPETVELLRAAGARVVTFDPLRDEALPAGTSGMVIGGGFPEVHVEALAANTALRKEIAAFDGPIVAECAGLLYLGRELDGAPMCGRLPMTARMTPKLTMGYREATATVDSCLASAGAVVRGHEFHRTSTDPAHGARAAWSWGQRGHGFVDRGVHASYLHTHWAGNPAMASRFVARAWARHV